MILSGDGTALVLAVSLILSFEKTHCFKFGPVLCGARVARGVCGCHQTQAIVSAMLPAAEREAAGVPFKSFKGSWSVEQMGF